MRLTFFAGFTGIILLAGQAFGADAQPLTSPKDKLSYTIGVASAMNLKQQSIDVDPDIMAKGLKDRLSGETLLLTEEEMREVMTAFRQEMAIKQLVTIAEKNKKEGEPSWRKTRRRRGSRPCRADCSTGCSGRGKARARSRRIPSSSTIAGPC